MFTALKWASDSVQQAGQSVESYWDQTIFTSAEATVEVPQVSAALKWASDSVQRAGESVESHWSQSIFASSEATAAIPEANLATPETTVATPEATVEIPQVSAALKWASDSVQRAGKYVEYYWGQSIFRSPELAVDIPEPAVDIPEATVDIPQVIVKDKAKNPKVFRLGWFKFSLSTQVKSTTLSLFHRIQGGVASSMAHGACPAIVLAPQWRYVSSTATSSSCGTGSIMALHGQSDTTDITITHTLLHTRTALSSVPAF